MSEQRHEGDSRERVMCHFTHLLISDGRQVRAHRSANTADSCWFLEPDPSGAPRGRARLFNLKPEEVDKHDDDIMSKILCCPPPFLVLFGFVFKQVL